MKRAYRWWSEEEKEKIFNLYINGKSYAEIAEIFNSTSSKIKSLMYRKRTKRQRRNNHNGRRKNNE